MLPPYGEKGQQLGKEGQAEEGTVWQEWGGGGGGSLKAKMLQVRGGQV